MGGLPDPQKAFLGPKIATSRSELKYCTFKNGSNAKIRVLPPNCSKSIPKQLGIFSADASGRRPAPGKGLSALKTALGVGNSTVWPQNCRNHKFGAFLSLKVFKFAGIYGESNSQTQDQQILHSNRNTFRAPRGRRRRNTPSLCNFQSSLLLNYLKDCAYYVE